MSSFRFLKMSVDKQSDSFAAKIFNIKMKTLLLSSGLLGSFLSIQFLLFFFNFYSVVDGSDDREFIIYNFYDFLL